MYALATSIHDGKRSAIHPQLVITTNSAVRNFAGMLAAAGDESQADYPSEMPRPSLCACGAASQAAPVGLIGATGGCASSPSWNTGKLRFRRTSCFSKRVSLIQHFLDPVRLGDIAV